MRLIEKRWKYLEQGYERVHSLGAQLDIQWKRSIQVAQRRKFNQEHTTWKRKRNKFILVTLGFILGCSLLCGLAYSANEWNLQCLYSFWAFILLLLGVCFSFFGRAYLRSVFNPPVLELYLSSSQRLEELWWKNLAPAQNTDDEGVDVFLELLSYNLSNSYIATPEILTSSNKTTDTDVLLLGPCGIWVFEVKHWFGTVYKKDGLWWQGVSNRRIDHLQDSGEPKQGPDEQWLNQVREIKKTLKRRRADVAWSANTIQGGIVFSNPEVQLEKAHIRGSSASFGKPGAWLKRIQNAQAIRDFMLREQFRVLDALIEYGLSIEREKITPVSAIKLADRTYEKVVRELTEYVEKWTQ